MSAYPAALLAETVRHPTPDSTTREVFRETERTAVSDLPRALARYSEREEERTKPSVMLLDWTGDDEATVRWETVRRETPAPSLEDEESPRHFQGIGGRAGGMILGIVLGVAVTICVLALVISSGAPDDASLEPAFTAVPQLGADVSPPAVVPTTPVGAGVVEPAAARPAVKAHHARTTPSSRRSAEPDSRRGHGR